MGVRSEINAKYSKLKMRESYQRRKKKAVEYKGGKCTRCGYSRSLAALEFHHPDPEVKDHGFVSGRHVLRPWDKQRAELDKCVLLCANCHREVHEEWMREQHAVLWEEVRKLVPERRFRSKSKRPCLECGEVFEYYPSTNQKFCCRKCKVAAQSINWPSDRTLSKLLQVASVSQVSGDLGTTPKTVRARCRKRGIRWRRFRQK